jgi:hypothetical protein
MFKRTLSLKTKLHWQAEPLLSATKNYTIADSNRPKVPISARQRTTGLLQRRQLHTRFLTRLATLRRPHANMDD